MGIPDFIDKEWEALVKAPRSFFGLTLICLGLGFTAGLWMRSEQVSVANEKIGLRDDKIKKLQDELAGLQEPVISVPPPSSTSDSAVSAPDKSPELPAPPKKWPDGDSMETSIERGLNSEQAATLERVLKANPSFITIRRARNTPKVFADQMQGLFNASGWKVDVKESAETQDYFIVKTAQRQSSDVLMQAFDGAKIEYNALDNAEVGSMSFFLRAPK